MKYKPLISTLMVDDDPLFRQNLKTLLELYGKSGQVNLKVIGETNTLAKAIHFLHHHHPDLMLLDLELEGESGLQVLQYLQGINSSIMVLVLSAHQEDNLIYQAMQAGAKGYIFKTSLIQQLPEAINTLIDQKIYLPPEVATQFFKYFKTCSEPAITPDNKPELTKREKEVLQYLIQGLSNEEIAQKLYITVATVKAHLTAIFNKLGVKNRTQAIITALKIGNGDCYFND